MPRRPRATERVRPDRSRYGGDRWSMPHRRAWRAARGARRGRARRVCHRAPRPCGVVGPATRGGQAPARGRARGIRWAIPGAPLVSGTRSGSWPVRTSQTPGRRPSESQVSAVSAPSIAEPGPPPTPRFGPCEPSARLSVPAGECRAKCGIRCGETPQTPSLANRRRATASCARPQVRARRRRRPTRRRPRRRHRASSRSPRTRHSRRRRSGRRRSSGASAAAASSPPGSGPASAREAASAARSSRARPAARIRPDRPATGGRRGVVAIAVAVLITVQTFAFSVGWAPPPSLRSRTASGAQATPKPSAQGDRSYARPVLGYNRRPRRDPPCRGQDGATMKSQLPIDALMQAVRQNTLVKILEQFEAAFPDAHLKDLVVDRTGPGRVIEVRRQERRELRVGQLPRARPGPRGCSRRSGKA